MATYIKGADTYLPNTKPFTPDYKFLSTVLQTRTDKYNANYKATNDIYNRVVYSDLSRQDTRERRDQYTEQIAPQIEKISGLDLSIQSNVDAAKGVFAPFYEDDVTVKDMVFTSRYRDQSQRAQNLLNSPDQTVQEKYWDVGVRAMQYKMDEFINSDAEDALRMALPQYVPKANLFKLSSELLSNMEPPLNMEMDRFNSSKNLNYNPNIPESRENPKLIYNTDWIITEQNGALVTGAALQTIKNNLLTNPAVQRSYQTEAYVSSMDRAHEAVKNGVATSISNGQDMWAEETIRRIATNNNVELNNNLESLRKAEVSAVNWSNYKGANGILPGSGLDKLNKEQLSTLEKYKLEIESKKQIAKEAERPSPTRTNLLNKAYNLYMQSNISNDMQSAAQDWSARNYSYKMTPNEFAVNEKKAKYNMALENARSTNAWNKAVMQEDRADKRMLKKAALEGLYLPNSGLGAALNKGLASISSDTNTIEVATNSAGEVISTPDIIENIKIDHGGHVQRIGKEQVARIVGADGTPGMLSLMNPKGDNEDENQTYGIKLSDGEYRGSLQNIRKKLLTTMNPDGTGGLKYIEDISKIYTKNKDLFTDTRQQTIDRITLTQGKNANTTNEYDDMYDLLVGPNGTDTRISAGDVFLKEAYRIIKKTYDNNDVLNTSQKDNNIKGFMEAGMPDIFTDNGTPMSREEYEAKVIEGVNNGTIKNYDKWGWDTGTSDKDYMMDEVISATYMSRSGEGPMIEKVREIKTGRKVLDERAIKAEAGQVYDELKTNLNAALTGKNDLTNGSVTWNSLKAGVSGTFTDVVSNPKYDYSINPLSRDADSENEMVAALYQLNYLKEKALPFGIGVGNLKDEDQLLTQDPLAVKVRDLLIKDLQTWINNPKRSNTASIAPIFKLSYMPVFDIASKANKDHSGYEFSNMDEWLASKKKGTNDNEIGALSMREIKRLQGTGEDDLGSGFFIVFNQELDQNIKAKRNDYFSSTEIKILDGENPGYADYKVPNDNGDVSTADIRVVKNGTGNYEVSYQFKEYNPFNPKNPGEWKEYNISNLIVEPVDFSNGLPGLDEKVNKLMDRFKKVRVKNQALREKDEKAYGKR